MASSFYVRGTGRLTRKLRALPERAQREVKAALHSGAIAVQRDAVAMVPVRTGNLKNLLARNGAIRLRKKGLQVVFGITGAKAGRDGFYARFVEYGTKGYTAGQRRRSGTDSRGRVQTRKVKRNVPPRAARPFMRPAFYKNLPLIKRRLRIAVRRALRQQT